MTTVTSIASRSEGQATEFRQLMKRIGEEAGELALEQVTSDHAGWQRVLDSNAQLRARIIETAVSFTRELAITNEQLLEWYKFYRDEGIELDTAAIKIPAKRAGFDRLLVIAEGLTAQQVYDKCTEHFACWKYTDSSLDEIVTSNDRDPKKGTYAVWVRDGVEADDELKNRSANDLAKAKIAGETLLERLIHELKYYKETGKHLDIENVTLCSGSRNSDGDVPRVCWGSDGDGLGVDWFYPSDRSGRLRSREVV